MHGDRIKKLS